MTIASERFARYSVLGVEVDAVALDDLNALIAESIATRKTSILAHHNLHSVYLFHHDRMLRTFFSRATITHIDGMLLVLIGRILGLPLVRRHRTTYVDWVHPLMAAAAQHGWRVFFLGGKPGTGERAADILRAAHPSLSIRTAHGYFDTTPTGSANLDILKHIHEFRTDILMVGMGMPRQEMWILDNLAELDVRSILPSGACMDYVAGEIPTPPRWMGRFGVEWLFRVVTEPRRLWKRYFVEPWYLLYLILLDLKRNGRGPARRLKTRS